MLFLLLLLVVGTQFSVNIYRIKKTIHLQKAACWDQESVEGIEENQK